MTRFILFALSLFLCSKTCQAQMLPEAVLNEEIRKAKHAYRVAKSNQLGEAIKIRMFLVSPFGQLTASELGLLGEADAIEYVPLVNGHHAKVLLKKEFVPNELPILVASLKKLLQADEPGPGRMCHYPTHCIAFYKPHKKSSAGYDPFETEEILRISISIHCNNLYFQHGEHGIQAIALDREIARELLRLIDIPLSEIERFETEINDENLNNDTTSYNDDPPER